MNSDETFKGHGYVEFASAEAAEKVPLSMSCLLCKDKLNDSSPNLCSITYFIFTSTPTYAYTYIYLFMDIYTRNAYMGYITDFGGFIKWVNTLVPTFPCNNLSLILMIFWLIHFLITKIFTLVTSI